MFGGIYFGKICFGLGTKFKEIFLPHYCILTNNFRSFWQFCIGVLWLFRVFPCWEWEFYSFIPRLFLRHSDCTSSLTDLLVWLPGKPLGDRKLPVAEANFTFRIGVIAPKVWKYEVQLREDLKIIVGHLKNSRRSGERQEHVLASSCWISVYVSFKMGFYWYGRRLFLSKEGLFAWEWNHCKLCETEIAVAPSR